jgi:hypothetical protein
MRTSAPSRLRCDRRSPRRRQHRGGDRTDAWSDSLFSETTVEVNVIAPARPQGPQPMQFCRRTPQIPSTSRRGRRPPTR